MRFIFITLILATLFFNFGCSNVEKTSPNSARAIAEAKWVSPVPEFNKLLLESWGSELDEFSEDEKSTAIAFFDMAQVGPYVNTENVISGSPEGRAGERKYSSVRKNECFSDLSKEFITFLWKKSKEDAKKMPPLRTMKDLNKLESRDHNFNPTQLANKPGWLWEKAMSFANNNPNLAMSLAGLCGDSTHGSLGYNDYCESTPNGGSSCIHETRGLPLTTSSELRKFANLEINTFNTLVSKISPRLMKHRLDHGPTLGESLDEAQKEIQKKAGREGMTCPYTPVLSSQDMGALGRETVLPSSLRKKNPVEDSPYHFTHSATSRSTLTIRSAAATCRLVQQGMSPQKITKLNKINKNFYMQNYCSNVQNDQRNKHYSKPLKSAPLYQRLAVQTFRNVKKDPTFCETTLMDDPNRGYNNLSLNSPKRGCRLLKKFAGSNLSEMSEQQLVSNMRDAYLKSGVNDVLLRNVFLGSDCDNKRMFNIHLNKMKKLSQAKGTSKCPKGYSLKKCQSAKNIVRGMLFELKRVESEIDTGAKFALKNCRKNLNFQPNNSSRYNDLNGASCAALNGLDRGASTDSLSTDR